jgi:hypothetical protein
MSGTLPVASEPPGFVHYLYRKTLDCFRSAQLTASGLHALGLSRLDVDRECAAASSASTRGRSVSV